MTGRISKHLHDKKVRKTSKKIRSLQKRLEEIRAKRSCGSCEACCVTEAVDCAQLHKPEMRRCPHLDRGCSIYSTKPSPCTSYLCSWRQGYMGDEERPDKAGVVVTPRGSEALGGHVQLAEVWQGATDDNEELVDAWLRLADTILIRRPDLTRTVRTVKSDVHERMIQLGGEPK